MKPFHFKHFSVQQTHSALKVGTDAMILGAFVSGENHMHILDIGTGCGVLALMMAQKFQNATIVGIDTDATSLIDCRTNFENSPWNQRLVAIQEDIFNYSTDQQFDLIVCNPPFYETTLKNQDERIANAKHGSKDFITNLLKKVVELLSENGMFWMIYPVEYATELAKVSMEAGLFIQQEIILLGKPNSPKRVIFCFSTDSKTQTINREFTIRNQDNSYTTEYIELTKEFHSEGALK